MRLEEIAGTLARHEAHLQRLIHGQEGHTRSWLLEHADEDPALAPWLAAQLRLAGQPGYLAQVPESVRLPWQGWLDYYSGDYPGAARCFSLAWRNHPGERAGDVALGLGKVYTRTGHWAAARGWLLRSLQEFRNSHQLFGSVEAYGALGELLLRAGHPQAAHACISTAYHVLPPGSGQQARQLNYLASTLMRTGARLRAESLLMTSLHMASDAGDVASVWHALARLQFLGLEQGERAPDVLETLADYVPTGTTPVATGFVHVGRALRFHQAGDPAACRDALQQAADALAGEGASLPCEQAWVARLMAVTGGAPYPPGPALGNR